MKRRRIKTLLGWLFLAWFVPIVRAVSNDDGMLALSRLHSEDPVRSKRLRQLRGTHERRKYRPQSMGTRTKKRQKRDSSVQNQVDNDNARNSVVDRGSPDTRKWWRGTHFSKMSYKVKGNGRPYREEGKGEGVYYRMRMKQKKKKKKSSKKKTAGESYPGKGGGSIDMGICEQYDFRTRSSPTEDEKFRNIFERRRPAKGKGGFSYLNGSDHENRRISGRGKIRNIFDRDLFFRVSDLHLDDERGKETGDAYCDPNVLEVARKNPKLSAFVRLVEQAGLADIFDCPGPFTFLAPINQAFWSLSTNILEMMHGRKNNVTLQEIVLYHILPGAFPTTTFQAGLLKTLQGEKVEISLDPIMFNANRLLKGDIASCNGVIHIIGDVLVPPSLDDGPPEPEVPEICSMLDFRFLSGRRLRLEGELCHPNVLHVAQDDPALSIFVSLLELSGLEEIFLCAGPFTTLMPTNDAFASLDPTLVVFLLRPENAGLLRDFLLYHIIGGLELTTEIADGPLVTLQGQSVEATRDPVTFNGAAVLEADIPTCNGVINKLEDVLLFPAFPVLPPATPTAASTFAPEPPTSAPTLEETPGMRTANPTPDASAEAPTRAPVLPSLSPAPERTPGAGTIAPTPDDSRMITVAPTPDGSASTAAPTPNGSGVTAAPTTSSPMEQSIRVSVTDYYIALVVPALEEEPAQEVINGLFNVTTQFWTDTFVAYYADSDIQFLGLDSVIVEFLYGADIPDPGFNMYFEWDTVFLYERGSSEPPGPAETFGIMVDADLVSYILDYVRTIPELVTTNEVHFKAIERVEEMAFQRPEKDLASRRDAGGNSLDTEDGSFLFNHSDSNVTSTDNTEAEPKQRPYSEKMTISSNYSNSNATVVPENATIPSRSVPKEISSIGRIKLSDHQSQLLVHSNHSQSSRNETLEDGEEIHGNIYCPGCIEPAREGSRVRVPPVGSKLRVPQAGTRARLPQKGTRVIVSR